MSRASGGRASLAVTPDDPHPKPAVPRRPAPLPALAHAQQGQCPAKTIAQHARVATDRARALAVLWRPQAPMGTTRRGGMWFFSMSRARNFYLALRERVVAVVAMPVVARSSSSFCTCDRKKFTRTREPGWPQCQLLLGVGERVQFGCAAVSTFEQTRGRQIELAPVSVSRFAPPQLKR